MIHVFLILSNDPAVTDICREAIRLSFPNSKHVVLTAATSNEADTQLKSFLPHVLVVAAEAIDWVEKVRKSPLRFLRMIVVAKQYNRATLARALQLKVDDYVMVPERPDQLRPRFERLLEKLESQPVYGVSIGSGSGHEAAQAVFDGLITGASETGLCVASDLYLTEPTDIPVYLTSLFAEMGLENPKLKMMTSESETRFSSAKRYRNFVEIIGWNEKERQALRRWVMNRKLRAIA